MTDDRPVAAHVHNAFLCPAHVPGCDCPDLEGYLCNPYCKPGYCPEAITVLP